MGVAGADAVLLAVVVPARPSPTFMTMINIFKVARKAR